MPFLTEADIVASFNPVYVARGRDYVRQKRVISATLGSDGYVYGRVQGSRREPYTQEIRVHERNGRIRIDGMCSCPMEVDCKHVVAAMLFLVQHQPHAVSLGQDEEEQSEHEAHLPPDPNVEDWLRRVEAQFVPANEYPPEIANRLLYVLKAKASPVGTQYIVELLSARILKDDNFGKTSKFGVSNVYTGNWPRYVLPIDQRIVTSLYRGGTQVHYPDAVFRIEGVDGARLLELILSTGRAIWEEVGTPFLRSGAPRTGTLQWIEGDDGSQTLRLDAQNLVVLPTAPPWFVDTEKHECGELDVGVEPGLLQALLAAPAIRPEHSELVRHQLARLIPDYPDLWPSTHRAPIIRQVDPIPHLKITRKVCKRVAYTYGWRKPAETSEMVLPLAHLEMEYDGIRVRGAGSEVRKVQEDMVVIMPRLPKVEAQFSFVLVNAGWEPGQTLYEWKLPKGHGDDFAMAPVGPVAIEAIRQAFYEFLRFVVPDLRSAGWQIEVEGDLEVPPAEQIEWQIEARDDGSDWFGLDLGIIVQGERVDLRPILVEAIRALARAGRPRMDDVSDDLEIYHELPNGKVLALPAGRLKPLLRALTELFGNVVEWPDELSIPISRINDAAYLEDALDDAGLQWRAPERMKELRAKVDAFREIVPTQPPSSLRGELRPYQAQGLSWLQFLREYSFGGILADDMGLGKTIETLAHILVEKEAGRLDKPALIVAPTSTLPNWRHEVERFAPSLSLLVLYGTKRRALFDEIPQHDLVLTSYPLLQRDKELAEQEFHLVVLDEAQNIKNPAASVTHAACALKASQRVCLSGTPVENNLDELWSLFHFLMPGLLGALTPFRRNFRTPIEQHGDTEVRNRLTRRIRPFVLRRTKEQVAKELPEKTEVVERVELAGPQRDLYESLRLAMDRQVREIISSKGFEKSRIEILDALLKLRQVCCDPRLVKLESARKVQASAKLERLMDMLDELRHEGKRILLFSQFTSMLDLIEESLKPKGYDWVRISGNTKDRDTPVKRFQAGEVPLFLISLKAGGTGLNLTAADTVIHYDPWWNPAVESQATDRAHRIGQEKAVFVFKLVAAGTVEEKILQLQERKAQLAGAILDGSAEVATSLTADDLRWVLSID